MLINTILLMEHNAYPAATLMLIASSVTMLLNVPHVFSVIMLIQTPIFVFKNLLVLFQTVSVALLQVELYAKDVINTSFFLEIQLHVLLLLPVLMEKYLMERLAHVLKESMILDQLVLTALVIA